MKKMKGLFLAFAAIGIFALASCKGTNLEATASTNGFNNMDVKDTNTTDTTSNNNTLLTPSYQTPSMTIDTIEASSEETAVERTVKKVYETTVSLTCTSTQGTSKGSGVLFGCDEALGVSYVVTCFHVIDGCQNYEVTLSDLETTYNASLVGINADYDIAVLSIKATNLKYASFYSNSDNLQVGSQVVCIGNPLGTLPGSVSTGVISFVNREIVSSSYTTMKLIQTDVAINSGNSGGALFNTSGALIGIVNAKYSSSGIEGLGFAIPINDVRNVITSILSTAQYDVNNNAWNYGYVLGDWELGFGLSDGYYGNYYNQTRVIYVSSVSTNTTTTGATELKINDIITGIKIDYSDASKTDYSLTLSSASNAILDLKSADLSVGDSLIFTITRNNASTTVTVVLQQYIYS